MIGIRKKLIKEERKIETGTKGLMVEKVKREKENWRIVKVYVGKGEIRGRLQDLEKWMRDRGKERLTIVGGL